MYKNCKSHNSCKRQEHISNCFQELLQEKPYDNITITELCEKANIPRNTFYRYFDGKNSILQYLIENVYITLLDIIFQLHDDKPQKTLTYYILWLSKYREYDYLWDLIYTEHRHDLLLTQIINHNTKLLANTLNMGFDTLQAKQIIFFSYGIQGILDVWKYTGYTQNEEEVAKQLYELLNTPMTTIYPSAIQTKAFLAAEKEVSYFIDDIHKIYSSNKNEPT